jgi:hypothetical protein
VPCSIIHHRHYQHQLQTLDSLDILLLLNRKLLLFHRRPIQELLWLAECFALIQQQLLLELEELRSPVTTTNSTFLELRCLAMAPAAEAM